MTKTKTKTPRTRQVTTEAIKNTLFCAETTARRYLGTVLFRASEIKPCQTNGAQTYYLTSELLEIKARNDEKIAAEEARKAERIEALRAKKKAEPKALPKLKPKAPVRESSLGNLAIGHERNRIIAINTRIENLETLVLEIHTMLKTLMEPSSTAPIENILEKEEFEGTMQ